MTNDKINNTRIIANALLKGLAKYVWLKDVNGKPVKVLVESLHENERRFLRSGDVIFDPARHELSSPRGRGTR
jgi:hypothetical protein